MTRKLTSRSSLDGLKREAKRWLRALRAQDPAALEHFTRCNPQAPAEPGLRDVQHALSRDYGFDGWTALTREVERLAALRPAASRDDAIQALLAAAERGDAERVVGLLEQWPDIVNERAVLPAHTGRRTALHFAMNSASEVVTDALLARGADPNIRDDGDNATPLHFAAEQGQLGIVRRLIEHGADPIGTGDMHGLEIIGWAACFAGEPKWEVVEYLLAHGGRHNLLSAVATGAVQDIAAAAGRDPESLSRPMDRANLHRRPLHLAVVKDQPESLAALLALGADIEAEDAAGLTPLDQAALHGRGAMADSLLARGAKVRLPAAVALDRPADVARILAEDPGMLRPGGRWDRLILRAAERSGAATIEALIRAGASVHVRDSHRTSVDGTHGYTALHAAAFHGNNEAIRVLLRHGASPSVREDNYWATPAGWANCAYHADSRDLILEGPIDIFEAIVFDRTGRLDEILARDPDALERPFGQYVTGERKPRFDLDPAWTPLLFAVARGKTDAVRLLLERGASMVARDSAGHTALELAGAGKQADIAALLEGTPPVRPRPEDTFERRVARFLRMACLDWRTDGSARVFRQRDATRLLQHEPEIAQAGIFSAVAAGAVDEVRHRLQERPGAASQPGGPHSWPPLLYLCSARLDTSAAGENAVEIARLLLDHGADPDAFYLGGNADIHYTALTCVVGRGEEQALTHPRAPELAGLLMAHGAWPYDGQVLYNVFADHASRKNLDEDIVWLLDLMYAHSVRRGHWADWDDPSWPMFAIFGAPSLGDTGNGVPGAYFMLSAAVDRDLTGLAEWMLRHGAGPNTPPGSRPMKAHRPLYQEAMARGSAGMARLLARYGADTTPPAVEGYDRLVQAALALDRAGAAALVAERPEYLGDHRALALAAGQDRTDAAELLLDLGVSPDVEDPASGARALHAAAYAGAVHAGELLLSAGAQVDARERNYDAIPLGVASWARQPAMIELLGRYSRDIWELTYTGRVDRIREVLREDPSLARTASEQAGTPLHWLPAGTDEAREIAGLLLAHGTDPSVRNAEGLTAGDIARRRGLLEVADLLEPGEA